MIQLTELTEGQLLVYGGDRVSVVPADLAQSFTAGDRLVIVQDTGDLLHIPRAEHELVATAVAEAVDAFARSGCLHRRSDQRVLRAVCRRDRRRRHLFCCARRQSRRCRRGVEPRQIHDAPATLAGDAIRHGRPVCAVGALHPTRREQQLSTIDHKAWSVSSWRAPLGVVGFVFEGRPNVFADATGVLRTGNTAVFRIGSDALGTAQAIMRSCVAPALAAAGLPAGAVQLIESAAHAAGWALFTDHRLALAVARGSGTAVAQLGAVARQHGVPVSLHGTGGAWVVVSEHADTTVVAKAVEHSLDRKVCNTMNVCCIPRSRARGDRRRGLRGCATRGAQTRNRLL